MLIWTLHYKNYILNRMQYYLSHLHSVVCGSWLKGYVPQLFLPLLLFLNQDKPSEAACAQTLDFIQGHLFKIQSYKNRICCCNKTGDEALPIMSFFSPFGKFHARNLF